MGCIQDVFASGASRILLLRSLRPQLLQYLFEAERDPRESCHRMAIFQTRRIGKTRTD
jgi:hypothetical protein